MEPVTLAMKPYQADFDTLLNPGRRFKNSPGTQFFYQYIRLQINQYPHALDKFSFRKEVLLTYLVSFQRGFYWFDKENNDFVPILSIGLAARCSRKIFENIQASVYRQLPLFSPQSNVVDNCTRKHISSKKRSSRHDDAILLLQNAKKMHQLFQAQFCSKDRVTQYTEILKMGVGTGKYAMQEKNAFQSIVDMFPDIVENPEDDEDYESDEDYLLSTKPPPKKKAMKDTVEELESRHDLTYVEISRFPIPKTTNNRFCRARVPLNTECFLLSKSRKVYVKLSQVLRSNPNFSELIYIFKSPPNISPCYYTRISELEFLQQIDIGNASMFSLPQSDTSASSSSCDCYTIHQVKAQGIKTFPIRHYPSVLSKKHSFDLFHQQAKSSCFVEQQRNFFSDLLNFMNSCSYYTEEHSLRVGWSSWVPSSPSHRWFPWQIVTLLLLTNSVHDKVVSDIASEMFRKFSTPIAVGMNPSRFIDFLTSKGKNFHPLCSSFDSKKDSISKAPNYCNQKANYIVAMSKKVILRWCLSNVPTCRTTLDYLVSRYCDYKDINSLRRPIPSDWLLKAEESHSTLFPAEYSHEFYDSLPGVGLKMRHLCSETIYNSILGPAIDCHCIRFAVEMGCVHASMSVERMNDSLTSIFLPIHYVGLNEIPATISQVLTNPQRYDTCEFVDSLVSLAEQHGLKDHFLGFLSHYPCPSPKQKDHIHPHS